MKKSLLTLSFITTLSLSTIFLSSCKEEEAPLPHEVGQWELDSYLFVNFPAGFQGYEGSVFELNQLTFNGVSYNEYILNLKSDGTFTRDIDVPGPDVEDSGDWTLEDDKLVLDSDDAGETEWKVEKNENNDLWISLENQNTFIPDIYYDTVTQKYFDYLNTLTPEQLDSVGVALSQVVIFDLVFVLEKQ